MNDPKPIFRIGDAVLRPLTDEEQAAFLADLAPVEMTLRGVFDSAGDDGPALVIGGLPVTAGMTDEDLIRLVNERLAGTGIHLDLSEQEG